MRKLYLIWLHILSLQFAFTTCCQRARPGPTSQPETSFELGATCQVPLDATDTHSCHCHRLLAFAVDAYSKLFCVFVAPSDIMHCFCFLCCRRGVQATGYRVQSTGHWAHTRHRGVDRGKMARHLHAMYEINYYALSHRPGQNLQHEALLGLRLRLRSSHSERLDSGIGIACPAHSNFQGTIRAFSALSLPSAF